MAVAKQPQSDKLWLVSVRNERQVYPSTTNLWILGSNAEVASRKARAFVKKNYEPGYQIIKIESNGTIDVF